MSTYYINGNNAKKPNVKGVVFFINLTFYNCNNITTCSMEPSGVNSLSTVVQCQPKSPQGLINKSGNRPAEILKGSLGAHLITQELYFKSLHGGTPSPYWDASLSTQACRRDSEVQLHVYLSRHGNMRETGIPIKVQEHEIQRQVYLARHRNMIYRDGYTYESIGT